VKRWIGILTICLLLVGMIDSPAFGAPGGKTGIPPGQAKKLLFNDLNDTPWAAGTIEKMGTLGLMAGYPGGKFLPNKPVTQLEALIMGMRVFNWAAGNNQNDSLWVTARSKGVPYWALATVVTAMQEEILPADLKNFQPNKPATRAQIAEIISKALAVAKENSNLEEMMDWWSENGDIWFIDEKDIPEQYRNQVRFIARLGIIKGYPDGTFQPNKPVTRAQMAALLSNLRYLILEEEDTSNTETIGYIVYKDINEDTSTIFIKTGQEIIKVDLDDLDEVNRGGRTLTENRWDRLRICDKVVLEKVDGTEKLSARYYGGKVELIVYIAGIDDEENTLEVETMEGFEFTYPVTESIEVGDLEDIAGIDIPVKISLQKGKVVEFSFLTD